MFWLGFTIGLLAGMVATLVLVALCNAAGDK